MKLDFAFRTVETRTKDAPATGAGRRDPEKDEGT